MICHIRLRVGVYASALLLLCGIALVAQATQPVTRSEMESFVLATLGAAGALVFGAFWMLLMTINGRSEKTLTAAVDRLEKSVDRLIDTQLAHDSNPLAHAAASEHNHGPMNAQMDRIEKTGEQTAKKLDELVREHNRIQETEGNVCDALRALRERNPQDSPHPRWKGDSGADYTAMRGKG